MLGAMGFRSRVRRVDQDADQDGDQDALAWPSGSSISNLTVLLMHHHEMQHERDVPRGRGHRHGTAVDSEAVDLQCSSRRNQPFLAAASRK